MQSIATLSVYNAVAVVGGARTSFLDHIMPLVDQWQIPLICTDQWVYTCAQHFYPPAEIILATPENFQRLLSSFTTFVSVEPCQLHPKALQFGSFLYRGPVETLCGFHGNPYKFRNEYWIERYMNEDCLLVYGQYLIDYLKQKGVFGKLNSWAVTGNLRKRYYEKYKEFFDERAASHLFSSQERKTILWAPTWSYPEWPQMPSFLKHIPEGFQVLVKLHPFMYRFYPEKIEALKTLYANEDKIRILAEIPLVYPLLARSDYYVGDDSSVAFDFLSLDRPLFLFGREEPWARKLTKDDNLFDFITEEDQRSKARQKIYRHVYERDWNFTG